VVAACTSRQGYGMAHCALLKPGANCAGMPSPIIQFGVIAAAFLFAGLIKGVTGLALPTGRKTGIAGDPGRMAAR
jgi:hypothetical protein